jgi:hypothetical protein
MAEELAKAGTNGQPKQAKTVTRDIVLYLEECRNVTAVVVKVQILQLKMMYL